MEDPDSEGGSAESAPLVGKIPVRNIWLLFLYASGLSKFRNSFLAQIEQSPDLKSLIARLLCDVTEKRLRRNLSFGYRPREDVLRRVRGRIDILKSVSGGLFRKGEVACRFAELTIDTPRNRFVRAAHATLSRLELGDRGCLSLRSRTLAHALGRIGVGCVVPSRAEMASDQIGRHEADDRLLMSLACAVFDLVLPTAETGTRSLLEAQRGGITFGQLFEKAVGNFFKAELPRDEGWRVLTGTREEWPVSARSSGLDTYLPQMKTDIVLENLRADRRTIIDTKFAEIFKESWPSKLPRFKTGHLYQLYSYLRSQEKPSDPRSLSADGILLYPSTGQDIDEAALIQAHRIRFVTVDLARPTDEVIERLRSIPTTSAYLAGRAVVASP